MSRTAFRRIAVLCLVSLASLTTPLAAAVAAPGARTISLAATVEAPAAEVYRLFSTSDGARTLFAGAEAAIGDAVGEPYFVAFDPDRDPEGRRFGTAGCRIVRLSPPRELEFEWRGPEPFPAMNVEPFPTRVRVRIEAADGGTGSTVRLDHTGFGAGAEWDAAYAFFDRAWRTTLDGLVRRYAAQPDLSGPDRLGAPEPSFVAFLKPGPNWVAGKPTHEQPRMLNHAAYMIHLMSSGVVWLGGPLVDRHGEGMSIFLGERAAVERYLRADPAVQAGTFVWELAEWHAGLPTEGVPHHGAPSAR
jgi:uncharacterized protein YndB with AHSA1/START domain